LRQSRNNSKIKIQKSKLREALRATIQNSKFKTQNSKLREAHISLAKKL